MEVMEEILHAFLLEFLEILYILIYGFTWCIKGINSMLQR